VATLANGSPPDLPDPTPIGSGLDHLLHDGGELLIAAVETAAIDYEILAFHETLLAQLVEKRGHHARSQWS
jgi:hypothetical protein